MAFYVDHMHVDRSNKKKLNFLSFPFFDQTIAEKKTTSTQGCDCERFIKHVSKKLKLEVFFINSVISSF